MGNSFDKNINTEELKKYIKPGLNMNDMKNLKKAFIHLDKNKNGLVEYDVKRISEIENYSDLNFDNEGHVILNFDQFMDIMTTSILSNRRKYGNDNIVFESETSNVTCILCPYRKKEEQVD